MFSWPVIGGGQATVVQAWIPRKLWWCCLYYSASPRNTLGILHTSQIPWGLSITRGNSTLADVTRKREALQSNTSIEILILDMGHFKTLLICDHFPL